MHRLLQPYGVLAPGKRLLSDVSHSWKNAPELLSG
jgi:hypothetical protein